MAPRQDLHQKKHSAPGKIFNKRRLNLICSTRCFFKYRDASEFCIVKSSSPPAFIILVGHASEACSPHHEKFHKERRNVIGPKILPGLKSGFELRVHVIFNLNCRPSKNRTAHPAINKTAGTSTTSQNGTRFTVSFAWNESFASTEF
jgi:hypothetical protein